MTFQALHFLFVSKVTCSMFKLLTLRLRVCCAFSGHEPIACNNTSRQNHLEPQIRNRKGSKSLSGIAACSYEALENAGVGRAFADATALASVAGSHPAASTATALDCFRLFWRIPKP